MPDQPFRDERADRRITTLFLFYLAALLSVIAISLVAKIPSSRTLPFALAVTTAGAGIFFLLRFLHTNDEREQQTNYRAKGSDDDGRGKSSSVSDTVENSDVDRLDDYKKNVLAESKDPDGILSAALDVIIDRARRSGINVSSRRYLDVALERFDFHGGQDKEDLMVALRGRVGRR